MSQTIETAATPRQLAQDAYQAAETTEAEVHRRFAHLRAHGEWFRLDMVLEGFIDLQSLAYVWNRAPIEARREMCRLISLAATEGYRDIDESEIRL